MRALEARLCSGAEMSIMDKHAGLIFLSPLCQNGPEQTEDEPGWRESRRRQTVVRQDW